MVVDCTDEEYQEIIDRNKEKEENGKAEKSMDRRAEAINR